MLAQIKLLLNTWLIKLQNRISSPGESAIVRRQLAKAGIYRSIRTLARAEGLSLLAEVISENVAANVNMSSVNQHTREIAELSAELNSHSFLFLLSQAIYSYIESKILPAIIAE